MDEESHYRMSNNLKQFTSFDPDWSEAQKHGQASKIGFVNGQDMNERCWCCFEQVNKIPIPLTQNTKQLQIFGFGFPLYYAFVRNCIFLLIVTIFSYNLISLYNAVSSNKQFCSQYTFNIEEQYSATPVRPSAAEKHYVSRQFTHFDSQHLNAKTEEKGEENKQSTIQCTSWMVFLSRVQKKVNTIQQLIRGGSILVHLILLVYIKDKLIKMKDYFDERNASPSDYSVLAKRIPKVTGLRKQIQRQIQNQYQIGDIAEIILIPDLSEYQALKKEKKAVLKELRSRIKKKFFDQKSHDLERQLQLKQTEIRKKIVQMKAQYNDNTLIAEKAILIFKTEHAKQQFLQRYSEGKLKGQNWQKVTFEQAPEPRQIIWQNISLSNQAKSALTCLGWTLSLLLLAVLTVIFAFVSKQKSILVQQQMFKYRHEPEHDRKYLNQSLLMVFGMIFFVVLFNKMVISTLFHKFTDLQRHASTYKFQFSFCLKYCLGLFFTTALMTLIVQAFILGNYYKHDYGVIEQQSIMYLVNSLFVPLFWLVNPVYLYRLLRQKLSIGKRYYTQDQANKIMQCPQYDVGKRYGQVLQVMWFTYLYMSLIPVGGLLSLLGLVIYYWIDKYNLLRRSSISANISGHLIHLTLKMLDFTLLLRTVGDLLFDYQIRDGIHASTWVLFGVSVIYQALPIQAMIQHFNQQKFKTQTTPYQIAQTKFRDTYYDQHILFCLLKEDREFLAQELMTRVVNHVSQKNIKVQNKGTNSTNG